MRGGRAAALFGLVLAFGSAALSAQAGTPALHMPRDGLAPAEGLTAPAGQDVGPGLRFPPLWLAQADAPASPAESKPPVTYAPKRSKDYALPALEIIGFDAALNLFDRRILNEPDYRSNLTSIRNNLKDRWVVDNDPYQINQVGHPYQGAMYHGFARSAGMSYWEAAGYTFAGSALWEIAGERTRPSMNDQVASGIAGSFFGEALFRMASLMLEHGEGPWREWAAAAISPSMGFNRHVMGYKDVFSSHGAPYYSRLSFGASGQTQNSPGASTKVRPSEALLDFSIDYGLPGKPGYEYTEPFDYFTFQGTASSANAIENVMVKGLLSGRSYGSGDNGSGNTRGLWGLYGSYDYIAPQTYRISSTALSLGTTLQRWLTQDIALQGTGTAGMGYAAVGTLHGSGENDYHYGLTPQALLALRLILGQKASLDMTAREYFVTRVGGATTGHDNIIRTDLAFTWRISGRHAVSFRYLWNRRDAAYTTLGDRTQSNATFGIFYTLLGSDRFGATDWR